jgi:amidophosphoribosyltransferase
MCGVFGVFSRRRDVARLAYFGLFALQHRGQESAGIAVADDGRITVLREMGLVAQVFSEEKLRGLVGQAAIGQTRYSTTGSSKWANAQPLVHHGPARTVAVAHNGNLTNAGRLRSELRAGGAGLGATSDTEVIAALLARSAGDVPDAAAAVMRRLRGAYSVVALTAGRLLAFRDPHGFRPLCLGHLAGDWVVSSESCALDLVGASFVREVAPGELVVIDDAGPRSLRPLAREPEARCIFELIYLARPDSSLAGHEVHGMRVRMGERLATEAPAPADLVVPVPDSGTPAAIGFARASGIPFNEGLIKNRYVARTFIQPDQGLREQGIRLKFNPLAEVRGQRVAVVDDSIVRGTTMRQIVAILFESGAREVHVRISSPPIVAPCFYGVDMADEAELIAAGRSEADVNERLGATSLAYLSLEGLQAATREPPASFCRACLTGEYPTRLPALTGPAKLRFEPAAAA